MTNPPTVWTIDRSTRTFDDFSSLLRASVIEQVVDVRIWPYSRRYPPFDGTTLAGSLQIARIRYTHLLGLGGHRRPRPDSGNTGWRNSNFRGYANSDHMQTSEFATSLAE